MATRGISMWLCASVGLQGCLPADFDARLAAIKGEGVEALESELDDANERIDALEASVEALTSRVTDLEAGQGQADTDSGPGSSDVLVGADIGVEVPSQAAFEALADKVDNPSTGLAARLGNLETDVATLIADQADLDADVTTLFQEIQALQSSSSSLRVERVECGSQTLNQTAMTPMTGGEVTIVNAAPATALAIGLVSFSGYGRNDVSATITRTSLQGSGSGGAKPTTSNEGDSNFLRQAALPTVGAFSLNAGTHVLKLEAMGDRVVSGSAVPLDVSATCQLVVLWGES